LPLNCIGLKSLKVLTSHSNSKEKYLDQLFKSDFSCLKVFIKQHTKIFIDTGGLMNSLTTSVPHCSEARDVADLRYCWLKDAIFNVRVF
jgi:GH15 family glucan-1,4-alpha-glucosidase